MEEKKELSAWAKSMQRLASEAGDRRKQVVARINKVTEELAVAFPRADVQQASAVLTVQGEQTGVLALKAGKLVLLVLRMRDSAYVQFLDEGSWSPALRDPEDIEDGLRRRLEVPEVLGVLSFAQGEG